MKSSNTEIEPILGTAMGGGFYAGRIRDGNQMFALIVAPKVYGELRGRWNQSSKAVAGAASYCDGLQNTIAMAEAGSELAQTVRALRIADADDWYIPAQDELEVAYRNLKPTADENTLYGRSGVNVSAPTPTYPYTAAAPAQTLAEAFQAGGAEAFEQDCYWTSTQHADCSGYAWYQTFDVGVQDDDGKSSQLRARAVRRLPI